MFYDEYSSETFAATIRKYMTDKFVQSETAQIVQSQTGQMPNILTLTTLTNHIEILCRCKRVEERLFYILYAHKETNFVDFLNLPKRHSESKLKHGLIEQNPSIGIILCPDADKVVVEYAMSRSMSPTMIA